MKLVKGDKLVCVKPMGNLVYGKTYLVINTRNYEWMDEFLVSYHIKTGGVVV